MVVAAVAVVVVVVVVEEEEEVVVAVLIKGSFVEKLRVTESEHSLALEIMKSSWHVP